MVTHEQAKAIKEYLDVWQMHCLDGTRFSKLEEVNRAVKAGTPRHPEFMKMLGMDVGEDKQTSEKIVEREMRMAKWRTLNKKSDTVYERTTEFHTGAEDIEIERQYQWEDFPDIDTERQKRLVFDRL